MRATSYFGYKCPRCGSTVDIGAVLGPSDEIQCPQCGAVMLPDPNGKTSAANVYCPKCNAAYGLINSDRCPTCGGPFSRL